MTALRTTSFKDNSEEDESNCRWEIGIFPLSRVGLSREQVGGAEKTSENFGLLNNENSTHFS